MSEPEGWTMAVPRGGAATERREAFGVPPMTIQKRDRALPDLKSEGRNPKAERRPKTEIRRPKPEAEGGSGFGLRVSAF
ncbi:MAG: hypothetical protein WCQ21_27680, partial [Verrucomicrobiota bacterium]